MGFCVGEIIGQAVGVVEGETYVTLVHGISREHGREDSVRTAAQEGDGCQGTVAYEVGAVGKKRLDMLDQVVVGVGVFLRCHDGARELAVDGV